MKIYSRLEDEDENAYIWRVCENKHEIGTWEDVCNLLNKELNHEYNESWYRKNYQSFNKLFNAIKDRYLDIEYLKELDEKKNELYKERCRLNDQRAALNKKLREDSRLEDRLDYLEECIKKSGESFSYNIVDKEYEENDLFVMLSDLHIGQTFEGKFGCYNTEIAKDRLIQYSNEIVNISKIHNSENCYISLQGDLISNSIHKSLAITNRENVIEQIQLASTMIIDFIKSISPYFKNITVSSVCGNHSRLDRKEDSLKDERFDDLIYWYIKSFLSSQERFTFIDNDDNTFSVLDIRGKKFINTHGDYDSFSKVGAANLIMMLGWKPDAITFGHMHTCAMTEESGIKMIRGGSFPGAGDDYTITKRLSGKPSQMVCVCDESGIKAFYPIELK